MTFLNTDLIRVSARLSYDVGGQDLVNAMYFELVSPSSVADALVLADVGQMLEVYYSTIIAHQNNLIQYIDYSVQNVTQGASPLTATWPTLTVGGSAVDALPPQVAALMVMRTAVSRKQGRIFLAGFADDRASGSAWIGTVLTAFANYIAQLLLTQSMPNGNYRYGVASVLETPPPRDIANAFTVPVSGAAVLFTRTQRRRSTGFGS